MQIGVCYFPEHWPGEEWEDDIAAMAEAGFEYVRMGEFSWAVLEPERGQFEFEWLEEAVDLVEEYDMKAVLCTPTATPPKWLVDEHPEIRQRERGGTVRDVGSRRHYCFNSERYQDESERIVQRMADHFADHAGVVGWQTDNEFGCHGTVRCYCDDCADAFREWLTERYGDAQTLNDAWGTTFWSQRYGSIDEVDPPTHTVAEQHPSLLLAYNRFASESAAAYNKQQVEVLSSANSDWFVSHNFMSHFATLDAFDVARDLDVVAWDSYPTGVVQDRRPGTATPDELRAGDPDHVSLDHDLYRGAKNRPFWVMEQQPGDVNWPPDSPQPAEGAMRLWAHQAVAHGADAVLYFRWRRCRGGQEQYHAGLRNPDGSPDRGYHDATQAAAELSEIFESGMSADARETEANAVTGGRSGGAVDAPVALVHDYSNLWALSAQPHGAAFDYWSLVDAFYGAIRARGVQVDVVPPKRSLDSYQAVVAPAMHLLGENLTAKLAEYVAEGGHLLTGPRTGAKDLHNRLRQDGKPGPMTGLAGATVSQHESLPTQLQTQVTDGERRRKFRTWAEWLDPSDAAVIWRYDVDGPADGKPAVVRNHTGSGTTTYCGVWPGAQLADDIVVALLSRAAVAYTERLPTGVRLAVRNGRTWICNFSSERYTIDADTDWLVGDRHLGAFDVAVAADNLVPAIGLEGDT